MSVPVPPLPAHQQVVTSIPEELAIAEGDVHIIMDSVSCPNALTNVYRGTFRDQPAKFREYRPLRRYIEAGADVRSMLIHNARLRRLHQSPLHIPVSGVCQTNASLGDKLFLVEAPYQYVGLQDYLAANQDTDRRRLLRKVLDIIADLHSRTLVHGLIRCGAFVVDPSGNLFLSEFETMRLEDPNVPFHPIGGPSIDAMVFLAPELLDSLRGDGLVALSRATDMYAVGCFAYEVFMGEAPFASDTRCPPQVALSKLISTVVDHNKRPERPNTNGSTHTRVGLTDEVWCIIEECWAPTPGARPSAPDLLRRFF